MSEEQHNTYTIQGLRVPELELRMTELRDSVSNLRMLVDAAAEAIIRVDRDVAAILEVLGLHSEGIQP